MVSSTDFGIIVQARMGSSRLPGKVLREINGRPILALMIDRLKQCNFKPIIVIATSNKESDKAIINLAKSEGANGFAAPCDENDVLTRYILAAQKFEIKNIIRVTADCPLIDPRIIESLVKKFIAERPDYLTVGLKRTFPHGVDVEIFTLDALERSSTLSNQLKEREHVVIPMRNNPQLFKIINVEAENELRRPEIRITVDYPEDFELMTNIYEKLHKNRDYVSTQEIIDFLDQHSKIKAINKHLII